MSMVSATAKPYKLGVALSGGGARGFAHVGALKAIEEAGHKPDVIAGVSAGAVVAVLYAAGVTPEEIMKLFTDMKFRDFCDFSIKGGGFFKIDKFKKHIAKAIGDFKNIEDLPIPLYIGVTDFDNGVPAAFSSGPICDAMIASCSIPILFKPVVIDGVRYVDGGVLKNLPAWCIRDKCEKLIGVNCSPLKLTPLKAKSGFIDVAMRTYNLMLKASQRNEINICDIGVEIPEIADYKTFNLKEIRQVYIRGYAATKGLLKQLENANQAYNEE